MATVCSACQAEAAEGARFCSSCGAPLEQGGAAPGEPDERRLVTILFADLAGSTAMGERLDPEDVRAVQRSLYELAAAEIERHGGVTEKFIGDAVVAVFGAPRAHEDDAERAVRAGLAILTGFTAISGPLHDRHGLDVGLRVGVDSGEVVSGRDAIARGELMVSGDAVNAAARLQQAALAGEVLCGGRVVHATGHAVQFGPLRNVDAKGKSSPILARPAVSVTPAPRGRARAHDAPPLVGRESELEQLRTVAARALDMGIPQIVTLYGPAGIGKSRLLAELAAARDDAMLIEGPCLPYGDGIAWWPLAEIARGLAGIRESDPAERSHALLDQALATLVDADSADAIAYTIGLEGPGSRTAALPTAAVPRVLRASWARLVSALGRRGPCILAIEDIHWAADALLELLEHLASTLDETAVLIVCPARHELLERRPGWGAGLRNHTAIDLRPLPAEAAVRLLDALLPPGGDPAARGRILERAGGNPFYCEEIVRMLRDRGTADGAIPDTVRAVIAARIDLLGELERRALLACSVVGGTFWAEAVDADPDVLDALAARDLVREHEITSFAGLREFAFRHALTREVAYAALSRPARRELHLRVAGFIERTAAGRESEFRDLIAHHYEQAIRAGEDRPEVRDRAGEYLLAAGVGALRRGATHAARRLLELAFDLGGLRGATAGLVLGEALLVLDELDPALLVLERVRETFAAAGDRERTADALGWLSRVHWRAGRRVEAVAAADAALQVLRGLPESPAVAHAISRRAQLAMLGAEPGQRALALQALAVARRLGDSFSLAGALTTLAAAVANETDEGSFEPLDEALKIAAAGGAGEEAVRAAVNFVWNACHTLPLPELDRCWRDLFDRALRVAEGMSFMIGYGVVSHALFVLFPAGRLDEAAGVLQEPRFRTVTSLSNGFPWAELEARLAGLRGDLLRAQTVMRGQVEAADRVGEPQRVLRMRGVAAVLAALEGDGPLARSHIDVALAGQRGRECAGQRVDLAIDAANAFRRLGDADGLAVVADELGPHLARYATPGAATARALLAAAVLHLRGEHGAAAEHLARARTVQSERGALLSAAVTDRALAEALAAAGDPQAAGAARARADAVLDPLGCLHAI